MTDDTTLDPGIRDLLDRLAAEPAMFDGVDASGTGVETARGRYRDQLARTARAASRPPSVEERPGADGAPVPVRWHRPETERRGARPGSGDGGRRAVFLHGGGWVLGGGDAYDAVAARLADDLDADVAAVDYRLAPEHPFPTPLEDAVAVARDLSRDGVPWVLVGDSAGANLAAGVALALGDDGPSALLLVYPPPDFEGRYASVRENGEGYWLTARDVVACSKLYLGGHDPRGDARLSPLRAPSLAGLPPTIVATAGFDPLRDAGQAFADALAAAGVDVRRREHPTLTHGFYGFTAAAPAADAAVAALNAELASLF